MLRANGETAEVQPPKQLANAAFMQFDAKLSCNAVRAACLASADRFAAVRKSAALISVRVIATPAISTSQINGNSIDLHN